jgi:ABC-type branched-subunit amino acid transport system ATPase component/branched-subunit amino acid ABC-type transport system permease component
MAAPLVFASLGLTAAAIYAALALGMVITYKGTGVVNFAAGAMAAWGTYVFDELHRDGRLILPIPFHLVIPVSIDTGAASTAVAMLAGLASAAVLGLIVHLLVFRPLRAAPPLAKIVASVGVMVTVDALVLMRFGTDARIVAPLLPQDRLTVAGATINAAQLWLGAAALALGGLVWAFFRFTRPGLALRAGAEDERAVALAGYAPGTLAAGAWMSATVVATLLCILAVPTLGLSPQVLTLLVVPALACALIGRFDAVGPTLAGALVLGVLQSELRYLITQSWWPDWAVNGLGDAVPFVVLIVVLFVVGRRLPERGAVRSGRLPAVAVPSGNPIGLVVLAVAGAAAILLTTGGYRYGVITSMIVAIAALSFVVVTGLIGQTSLAQAAIAGTAGFTLSKLAADHGVPFPVSPIAAVLVATALGTLVGVPALRIRGAQLAVVTLAGAVALQKFVFENPSFTAAQGNPIPDAHLMGVDLAISRGHDVARVAFALFVLAVLVAACALVGMLMRSATGRRFMAVRENERAAAAAGIDVARSKLMAFAIASALAGTAGCLLGYSRQQLSADSFTVFVSLSWLAFAYLGGITSIGGALIAGTFAPLGITYVLLDRWLDLGTSYTLISGLALIATAVFNPEGIAGAARALIARRQARGIPASAPSHPPAPSATPRPRPARDGGAVVLAADDLSVAYGGVRAVDGVSLRLHRGEVVGLIGPNGAGKTSVIDALTGFAAASGAITLMGTELHQLAPHERARRGLRRTWQSVEAFGDLTVRENLEVATARDHAPAGAAIERALTAFELAADAGRRPGALSLGHQKLLGVARALAAAPPVLLLDEPAAGLDTIESTAFGRRLRAIADDGVATLLVDHDMGLVLGVCDYVYVLDFGSVIAEGTPEAIRRDGRVIAAYLGGPPEPAAASGAVMETLA